MKIIICVLLPFLYTRLETVWFIEMEVRKQVVIRNSAYKFFIYVKLIQNLNEATIPRIPC